MAKKKGHRGKHAFKNAAVAAAAAKKTKHQKAKEEEFDLEAVNSAAMASTTNVGQAVMVKMCRLCESKDGPFLNIFDGEKVLAYKINRLLPLVIDENDNLPHKICFRCSAKVEELHEFAQKCIRAQENLRRTMGSESKAAIARKNWEEKLKENKMSNDDYCESIIKKAMEKIIGTQGIDHEPLPEPPSNPTPPPVQRKFTKPQPAKTVEEPELPPNDNEDLQMVVKQTRVILDKPKRTKDEKPLAMRPTRSKPVAMEEIIQHSFLPHMEDLVKPSMKVVSESKLENVAQTAEDIDDSFLVGMVVKQKSSNKKLKKEKAHLVEEKVQEELKQPEKKMALKRELTKERLNGTPEKAPEVVVDTKEVQEEPEHEIMQHVCTIKVGGAGYLFQCKLCKRNFLKKEVVLGHGCAKIAAAKAKSTPKAEPPKPPLSIMELPKTLPAGPKFPAKVTRSDKEIIEAFKSRTAGNLSINNFTMEAPALKAKPGPASRKKGSEDPAIASIGIQQLQKTPPPTPQPPPPPPQQSALSVELPTNFPNSKNRYKLVPGPNNTFTLIEDCAAVPGATVVTLGAKRKIGEELPKSKSPPKPESAFPGRPVKLGNSKAYGRKKPEVIDLEENEVTPQPLGFIHQDMVPIQQQNPPQMHHNFNPNIASDGFLYGQCSSQQSILPQLLDRMDNQPYPVGLFQTIPRNTGMPPQPVGIQTPAHKKQSYTVVSTGNPSKLVISTKQIAPAPPVVQPTASTKGKKGKKNMKATPEPINAPITKQPFSVTLEDSAPQKDPNEGFFTFINVDPLLQPSYVLPTTSIIQESQITTSTAAKAAPVANKKKDSDLYSCELCNMEFTREKKLLAHLQTHYAKHDEEEDDWGHETTKKRSRKS